MSDDKVLYMTENLPIFQNKVYNTSEKGSGCPVGDIRLVQNCRTGIVENSLFNPDIMKYDKDYQNEQACSPVFQEHLKSVSELIKPYFYDKNVMELGCGKGYFLEYLLSLGYGVTGVDPAYEGENKSVIKQKFDQSLGMQFDGVVLRHVLEHISDPLDFLWTVANSNSNKGIIYIEVPCLDWIINNRAWFDIFYEHVNYFRASDFSKMFDKIIEIGHSFDGQYLYVIADMTTLKKSERTNSDQVLFPDDFMSNIDEIINLISSQRNAKRKIALWGTASKGVVFTHFLQKRGIEIDVAIDINPVKQGKFMAGSGVLISTPNQAMEVMSNGDLVIITNSNYLEEIKQQSNNNYNYITVDR